MEATQVCELRLNTLLLLIAIAYTTAIIQGAEIKQKGVQEYICRLKETGRSERRHSTFHLGLSGQIWVDSIEKYRELAAELMILSRNKPPDYQRGQRAFELINSTS
jgi:hypothetical protein